MTSQRHSIERNTSINAILYYHPTQLNVTTWPLARILKKLKKDSYLKFQIHEYMFPTSFKWAEDKILLWTLNVMTMLLTYHPAFVIINALLKCEWLLSRIFTPQMPLFHQEILDISACTFDTRMLYIWYLAEPVLSYICILFLCLNFYFVT